MNLKELINFSKSKKLTAEEYEQLKADRYNASEGELNADGYDCRLCKNKGFIAEVQYQEYSQCYNTMYVDCRCRKIHSALRRLHNSGLKDVVKRYAFDTYDATEEWQRQMKDTAQKFLSDGSANHWLFMGGQNGCGKSHLCTAVAIQYIREGYDVKYMLWLDEVNKIKAVIKENQEYYKAMKELKEAQVLYIDDLFKNGKDDNGQVKAPTAADIKIAFEILNYRYNRADLITIISSERSLQELCDIDSALGGRIAERTKNGDYCVVIKKDIKRNYRLKGIKEI